MNAAPDRAASSGDTTVISIGRPRDATDSSNKTRLVKTLGIQDPPASTAEKTDFARVRIRVGMTFPAKCSGEYNHIKNVFEA